MAWFNSSIELMWNIIKTIRVTDVADMAIMAFIIYKVTRFVMRTSSAKAVKGILLIVVAVGLASILKLSVLSFLLGKTMELGILAIIIIFQPELRRMLDRVGSGRFSNIFGKQAHDEHKIEAALSQVVLACASMSKSRTGALIVFERETKVDDVIKTGTLINADVSAELVKNIFYPKAPLHDGALIVRDAQLISAGCMLPMSDNQNLSRDLGMRHRAGIGLSEQSDAVVVIVSEETGSISVAMDGMLKRHLALDTLEKLLRNELVEEEKPRESTVNKVRNTLKVKFNGSGKGK